MSHYPPGRGYSFDEQDDNIGYEPYRSESQRTASAASYFYSSQQPQPPQHDQATSERQQRLEAQRGGYGVTPANFTGYQQQRSVTQPAQAFAMTERTPPRRKPLPPQPYESPEESYEIMDRGSESPPARYQDHVPASRGHLPHQPSYSSQRGLAAAGAPPGLAPVDYRSGNSRGVSPEPSLHGGYGKYPSGVSLSDRDGLGTIDPTDIYDEEDDDPFSSIKQKGRGRQSAAAGAAGGAGAFIKGLTSRDASGQYGQVPGATNKSAEQSEWLHKQNSGNKRLKWIVGGVIVLIILLAVGGGVAGIFISRDNSSSDGSSAPSNKLTKNSPRIQQIFSNQELHKVFQGMDYTPLNTQYPDCLGDPPSQDDVTIDVATLSRLTPRIRLYGTDCNQTEMVLEAIDKLDLQDDVKVWLGIYLDGNSTTNTRQIDQAYSVLSKYGADPFAGVIVGNEVLFSEYMTLSQLQAQIAAVRSHLTSMNIDLPISTSSLGSNWTASLAESVDVIMPNIHAFFGEVPAPQAAGWTWQYYEDNNAALAAGKEGIISEMGWPTQGGHDGGAVAGMDELNLFLSEWVCQALTNGTQYFWFEALDEPWKVIFNTATEHWEPHWGLMDTTHNLKPGVKIPDCGGRTAKGWP